MRYISTILLFSSHILKQMVCTFRANFFTWDIVIKIFLTTPGWPGRLSSEGSSISFLRANNNAFHYTVPLTYRFTLQTNFIKHSQVVRSIYLQIYELYMCIMCIWCVFVIQYYSFLMLHCCFGSKKAKSWQWIMTYWKSNPVTQMHVGLLHVFIEE